MRTGEETVGESDLCLTIRIAGIDIDFRDYC